MAAKKAMWRQGDPASMMQSGKRIPVAVLGLMPGEDEDGEPKVSIRLMDGTIKEVHPNVLLAPGQVKQYRQRKARVEKGGIAAEANRMAREGYRLFTLLGIEEKDGSYGEDTVRLATLLFERDVPAEIEPVLVAPLPPDDHVEADDEPTHAHDEPDEPSESQSEIGDEPEDRDRM